MAKIFLEKYVGGCIKAFTSKVDECVVLHHIDMVKAGGDYNSLEKRVIYDVGRFAYKPWENLSSVDYENANDKMIYSLYKKAFSKAFPNAWKKLND